MVNRNQLPIYDLSFQRQAFHSWVYFWHQNLKLDRGIWFHFLFVLLSTRCILISSNLQMSKLDQTRIQLERRVTSDDQVFALFILNLNECLWYLSQVQVWNYTKYLWRGYAIEPLNKEFQITIYDCTFFQRYQYFQQFL